MPLPPLAMPLITYIVWQLSLKIVLSQTDNLLLLTLWFKGVARKSQVVSQEVGVAL